LQNNLVAFVIVNYSAISVNFFVDKQLARWSRLESVNVGIYKTFIVKLLRFENIQNSNNNNVCEHTARLVNDKSV